MAGVSPNVVLMKAAQDEASQDNLSALNLRSSFSAEFPPRTPIGDVTKQNVMTHRRTRSASKVMSKFVTIGHQNVEAILYKHMRLTIDEEAASPTPPKCPSGAALVGNSSWAPLASGNITVQWIDKEETACLCILECGQSVISSPNIRSPLASPASGSLSPYVGASAAEQVLVAPQDGHGMLSPVSMNISRRSPQLMHRRTPSGSSRFISMKVQDITNIAMLEDRTTLVWQDRDTGCSLALCFGNAQGCEETRLRITKAHTVVSALKDEDAASFWINNVGAEDVVRWLVLVDVLQKRGVNLTGIEDKSDTPSMVTVGRFSKFLAYFGPIKDIVDKFKATHALPYFHGELSTVETDEILSEQPEGTYLMRLGSGELFDEGDDSGSDNGLPSSNGNGEDNERTAQLKECAPFESNAVQFPSVEMTKGKNKPKTGAAEQDEDVITRIAHLRIENSPTGYYCADGDRSVSFGTLKELMNTLLYDNPNDTTSPNVASPDTFLKFPLEKLPANYSYLGSVKEPPPPGASIDDKNGDESQKLKYKKLASMFGQPGWVVQYMTIAGVMKSARTASKVSISSQDSRDSTPRETDQQDLILDLAQDRVDVLKVIIQVVDAKKENAALFVSDGGLTLIHSLYTVRDLETERLIARLLTKLASIQMNKAALIEDTLPIIFLYAAYDDTNVQQCIAYCLANLVHEQSANKEILVQRGVLEPLSTLALSENEYVQANVAWIYANLAQVESNRQAIVLNALPPLLKLKKASSEKVRTFAHEALKALGIVEDADVDSMIGEIKSLLRPPEVIWEIQYDQLDNIQYLSSGGHGDIFKALWLGTWVVVKKVKDEYSNNLDQFKKEIETLSQLRHPNVILFMGACLKPPCIITEYMDLGSLWDVLHNKNMVLILSCALQMARGLSYLHKLGYSHGDLKSLNILVDQRFVVKVADFGLARHISRSSSRLKGTYGWQAPEVFLNMPYTKECDVYSYGIMLWELLTRKQPFAELDVPDIKTAVCAGVRPPVPSGAMPMSLSFLSMLMQRCWDKDAKKRPSFDEICDQVANVAKQEERGYSTIPR